MTNTKYSILEDRLDAARVEIAMAIEKMEKDAAYLAGLEETYCGLNCGGCGEFLTTEKDFAQHFTIPDQRFLNLGNCPHSKR